MNILYNILFCIKSLSKASSRDTVFVPRALVVGLFFFSPFHFSSCDSSFFFLFSSFLFFFFSYFFFLFPFLLTTFFKHLSILKYFSFSDLLVNPFGKLLLPISELLDLTLPPVDAVYMSPWPRPLGYYMQVRTLHDIT